MRAIIITVLCLMLSGCINASYRQKSGNTEFMFRLWNEAGIQRLDITAPGGWKVVAERMENKTAIDQGIIAEAVLKTIPALP